MSEPDTHDRWSRLTLAGMLRDRVLRRPMRGTVGGQASRPGKCGRAECRPLVSPEPPTLLPWGGDNVHSPGLAPDATISRRHFAKERILQQAQQLVSRPGRGKIQDSFGTLFASLTPLVRAQDCRPLLAPFQSRPSPTSPKRQCLPAACLHAPPDRHRIS